MSARLGHIVWRVDAIDETAGAHTFDAIVLRHEDAVPPSQAGSGAEMHPFLLALARMRRSDSYFRRAAPFEATIPSAPFTLVVSPHAGSPPVKVSFASFDANGTLRASGSCDRPCAIIVHTQTGTVVTSLPESESESPPLAIDGALDQ
jgi:hypothetical protein